MMEIPPEIIFRGVAFVEEERLLIESKQLLSETIGTAVYNRWRKDLLAGRFVVRDAMSDDDSSDEDEARSAGEAGETGS